MSDVRPALSRERIAQVALELIDANGLAGLSMRKLGAELGVEAMSLYHYVANKNDLLDAVSDRLYEEIELPDVEPGDWETAIRKGLRAFHDVLVRHEAALELFASREVSSEAGLGVLYWAHQQFVAAGLSAEDAHTALHFAVSFVMGHAANDSGGDGEATTAEPGVAPEVVAFFERVQQVTRDEMFDAGLEAVVAGLRARYALA